jgi:serine protease AprX
VIHALGRRPSLASRLLVAAVAASILALAAPALARADAFVPAPLLERAAAEPAESFRVVVTGSPATAALLRDERASNRLTRIRREFQVVDGAAVELTGAQLTALARKPWVRSITPDASVQPTGDVYDLWPAAVGLDRLDATRGGGHAGRAPAIAVVDSGVDPGRAADFGSRVIASVNLSSTTPDATGDDNGHGTLVAGVAAGTSAKYPGAAPSAEIVSLRVVGADGSARTSDVIAAADWIYRNRIRYGIGVANFSLHSGAANYGFLDPLNAAVRRLWLTGTVVVAAAGNDGPQRMLYAPASDPFVITVGAVGINGTAATADDTNPSWSSYGHTAEGFAKPELAAPGRYIAGPVPASSTLATSRPERVLEPGYMWMSGTSFSAPVVSGIASQLLARHPSWTPDDVKGALMLTARPLPAAEPLSGGVGEVDAAAAADVQQPPNPNENLYDFVQTDRATGEPAFDAEAWNAHVSSDATWTSATWTSATWTSATWTSATWTSATWTSASWTSAAHTDATWTSATWTSATWTSATWTSATWTSATWTSAAGVE